MPKANICNDITIKINGIPFKVSNIVSEEQFIVEGTKEVSFLDKYSSKAKLSAKENLKSHDNVKDIDSGRI